MSTTTTYYNLTKYESTDNITPAGYNSNFDVIDTQLHQLAISNYPVGALYLSYESTSPASLFGGTWVQITDKFLRAANDVNTGGSDTHTLTTSEMPSHNHGVSISGTLVSDQGWHTVPEMANISTYGSSYNPFDWTGISIGYSGGNGAHNNMPEYQDIYVWRRTA